MSYKFFFLNRFIVFFFFSLFFIACNTDDDQNRISDDRNIDQLNAKVVQEWSHLILELERYCEGMRPNASARAFAYMNLATYETAVTAMPNYSSNNNRYTNLLIDFNKKSANIDYNIALNSCFARVSEYFLFSIPNNLKAKIKNLENRLSTTFGGNSNKQQLEASKNWGIYVANQVIEYSKTDTEAELQLGSPQPLSYEPPIGEGFWTYSANEERALFPYWGSVRTFVIDLDNINSIAPLPYSTATESPYFKEMMEVYEKNNAAKNTNNEDLWIAEFWSDDVENLMFSPPARQISIAYQLIEQQNLNLEEALVLYLKLGFALNDAAVATWKHKYEYMVMRPNVFIQQHIDASYQTNLFRLVFWPNPSFPAYPSGHSCFAAAAAGVFIETFGNEVNFADRSHEGRSEFKGKPRNFSSFEKMAKENAYSRIPLGVHMRMDCAEGMRLGYDIADEVNAISL